MKDSAIKYRTYFLFIMPDIALKAVRLKCIFKFYLARVNSIPAEISSTWFFTSSFYRGIPFYLPWVQTCTVYAFISVIELPRIPAFYPKSPLLYNSANLSQPFVLSQIYNVRPTTTFTTIKIPI